MKKEPSVGQWEVAEETDSPGPDQLVKHGSVTELVRQVDEEIRRRALLRDGQNVLVAVSGGVDSMVLLHLLHALAAARRWRLLVAHYNHHLRGEESDEDARFVARQAEALGLRLASGGGAVREFARTSKVSIEMAARRLRHQFLAATATATGCPCVALAHHGQDQVELFFLRLLRGAGTQGLGGMDWSSPSPVAPTVSLVRPLLEVAKERLVSYASDHGILFREDSSNQSADYLRNRLRRQLLPRLRRDFQPHLDELVLRAMNLLQAEGDYVTAQAVQWMEQPRRRTPFAALHPALQRRILHLELLGAGVVPQFEHVEALRLQPGTWLTVGPGQVFRRDEDGRLERRAPEPDFNPDQTLLNLHEPADDRVFAGLVVRWRFLPGRPKTLGSQAGREYFDAAAVGTRITLRHWAPGDRFQPIGLGQAVKLQDYFVNRKVSRGSRHCLVVAATESGEIFWVEGQRIGERFKVRPDTGRVLRWQWKRQKAQ